MKLAWPVNSPPNGRLQQVPVELTISSSSSPPPMCAELSGFNSFGVASAESLDVDNREDTDRSAWLIRTLDLEECMTEKEEEAAHFVFSASSVSCFSFPTTAQKNIFTFSTSFLCSCHGEVCVVNQLLNAL